MSKSFLRRMTFRLLRWLLIQEGTTIRAAEPFIHPPRQR